MNVAIVEEIRGFEPEPITRSGRTKLAIYCKLTLAALLSLPALTALPAHAASIDMATFTCQDWVDASDDEQDQIIAWLRGYLAGRSSATLYDAAKARLDRDTLMVACRRAPTIGVISAMSQTAR